MEEQLATAHVPLTGIAADPAGYQAKVRPAKTAIIALTDRQQLTYRELDEQVARTAGWLVARIGDPRGRRVAMLGRNSIPMIVLSLACQRAGAIFVPLSWRLARPEIFELLADCAADLLIVDDEFAPLCEGSSIALIGTPEYVALARTADPGTPTRLDPSAPVILLYTSGTTGKPKGVVVTAENAFYAALNFALVGELGSSAVAFSDLPMFHTIGLIAVARTTLMMGATLLVTDRFVPSQTLAALADPGFGITHYFAVPVMAEALEQATGFAPSAFDRLHAVFLGGAPLSPALIERFLERGVALVNGYGMSETGTAIHVPIDRDAIREGAGAVGHPAPYIDIRLVTDGSDAAPGELGEIWLRGPSVSPGYWGQAAATAAVFTDGWYRTGDLARIDASGQYRIVDRLKDMYVSGGENVYPAEVEAVLLSDPLVADAAVVGIPDPRWGETGVAFVVPVRGTTIDPDRLLALCAARIARYKSPTRILTIGAIPRSAAGKTLKQVLRAHLNQGSSP